MADWGVLTTSIMNRGIRETVPLMLPALGELFVERAGLVNIGIEGMMLAGAFTGAAVGWATGSGWMGFAGAAAAGAMIGLLFAAWTVWGARDQIVTGLGINLLALGFTGMLVGQMERAAADRGEEFVAPSLGGCGHEWLGHDAVTWAALLLVPMAGVFFSRTRAGLSLQAVGENPEAADTAGIRVNLVKTLAVIVGASMASMGGAYLTLGISDRFQEGMTSGRGFVALALVIFGKWSAVRIGAAALFFGLLDALQMSLQPYLGSAVHLLYPALLALPYVVTLVALAGFIGRANPPATLAIPYRRAQ